MQPADQPRFEKYVDGLVPAIVQHVHTRQVLMLGYVSQVAFEQSLKTGVVTFFSRSKQRLWTKGETSGHVLNLKSYHLDCDQDALLMLVEPVGPTCHTGSTSCFATADDDRFLYQLEQVISQKLAENNPDASYTARLVQKGIAKVAQKVGEEGVEVVIEAMRNEPEKLLGESADLLYHLIVLLKAKGFGLADVESVLKERHK